MSNSSLVNCTVKSPNHSGARTHAIDRITPHCVVGQLSAESIGGCFDSSSVQASCNYGIGKDGRVVLVVDECNRSWCSSSNANDQRAVTIECASDMSDPYAMTNAVYEKLIALCVDICRRNGKTKLIWFGDKNTSLNYSPKSNEMVLTVHRWFANKSCPGDWLYSRLGDVANRVTAQLSGSSSGETTGGGNTSGGSGNYKTGMYKVNVADLNIRKGPGTNYGTNGVITDKGTYTITEIQNGSWGKLKSGATVPTLEPYQGEQVLLAVALLLALLTRPERTKSVWMNSIFGKVLEPITARMVRLKIEVYTRSRRFRTAHGEN